MSKEETNESNSRREAIEKGINDVDKLENKDDSITSNKEIKETPKENSLRPSKNDEASKDAPEGNESNEDSENDPEGDPEEINKAVQLYKALNDPQSGPKILKILAQEAGLLNTSNVTEQKKIEKSIKEVLKESLGVEYQFLSDRIGDALEKILPDIAAKSTREISAKLELQERTALSKEIDLALNETFNQYDSVPKSVEKRFNELIDEMPPVPGKTNPKVYFNRLIKIASDEVGVELTPSKENKSSSSNKSSLTSLMKDRINRNKNDASSRLASKGAAAEVEDTSKSTSSPIKSRREAVERAVKEAEANLK